MRTYTTKNKLLTGWNDYIWVPEGASGFSPDEVCYDDDQWKAIVDKYASVFASNPDIFRIVVHDPLDFALLESTDYDGDDMVEFDWRESGWRLALITVERDRTGWITFYQKHASDIEMQVFLRAAS